jgi:quinol monooxygenase YgiN
VLSLHILDHHINRNSDEGLGALIHVGQPPNLPCYAGAEVAETGIDRRQSLLELKVIKHCIAGDGAVCHAEKTRLGMMDHGTKSIQLVGRIVIDLEHRNAFLERTTELCNLTNTIEAPLLFQCCEDLNAPGHFLFYEIWSTPESLEAHFLTAHFRSWNDWVTGKVLCEPEIRIGPMKATTILMS